MIKYSFMNIHRYSMILFREHKTRVILFYNRLYRYVWRSEMVGGENGK